MNHTSGHTGNRPLLGLILSGGKSTRMGKDKGLLQYHDKPQREFLYDLAQTHCDKVFYSLRIDQPIPGPYPVIRDSQQVKGPFNGLLSAHQLYPRASWLVLACDLPLLDKTTLEILVNGRDTGMDATALATRASGLPEPLAAIWEPTALQKAAQWLRTSLTTCPRKFLLQYQTRVKLVFPESDEVLLNANSPEDMELVYEKLKMDE